MPSAAPATFRYPHIELDVDGIPYIGGTTLKVVELVMAQRAYGWSPAEIHFQHPSLSLSQIHAALAYYWDHKDALDEDIERRCRFVDELRQQAGPSSLKEKLQGRDSQS